MSSNSSGSPSRVPRLIRRALLLSRAGTGTQGGEAAAAGQELVLGLQWTVGDSSLTSWPVLGGLDGCVAVRVSVCCCPLTSCSWAWCPCRRRAWATWTGAATATRAAAAPVEWASDQYISTHAYASITTTAPVPTLMSGRGLSGCGTTTSPTVSCQHAPVEHPLALDGAEAAVCVSCWLYRLGFLPAGHYGPY